MEKQSHNNIKNGKVKIYRFSQIKGGKSHPRLHRSSVPEPYTKCMCNKFFVKQTIVITSTDNCSKK